MWLLNIGGCEWRRQNRGRRQTDGVRIRAAQIKLRKKQENSNVFETEGIITQFIVLISLRMKTDITNMIIILDFDEERYSQKHGRPWIHVRVWQMQDGSDILGEYQMDLDIVWRRVLL